MMESIALNESHMVHDDDYVIVQVEDMGVDEDSYDDCDEELMRVSPLPSSSTLVCSEGNASKGYIPNDLDALIEDSVTASIVSLEECDGDKEKGDAGDTLMAEPEDSVAQSTADSKSSSITPTITIEKPPANNPEVKDDTGHPEQSNLQLGGKSRLSNKKKRKKVKMLKKAAAAAAAAAALAEMNKSSVPPSSPVRNVQQPRQKSPKSAKSKKQLQVSNLAVSCATESLASYRHDHNLKAKKTAPNYVTLL